MNFVFFLKTIVPCDIPKKRKRKKKQLIDRQICKQCSAGVLAWG